ncbi:hypothetical protein PoB_007540300 [Plakobranchus ocellatus]|uniref:G-protein coupled receptors family 1 profile domain-containing protein n=1 Tax=Plakobranchus ocellatus TaxID=259542 RepID=A0AAV4DWY6_9GAST|nr:hypothetical protein PoB_007540300 [Plakobranchus ocellatus]
MDVWLAGPIAEWQYIRIAAPCVQTSFLHLLMLFPNIIIIIIIIIIIKFITLTELLKVLLSATYFYILLPSSNKALSLQALRRVPATRLRYCIVIVTVCCSRTLVQSESVGARSQQGGLYPVESAFSASFWFLVDSKADPVPCTSFGNETILGIDCLPSCPPRPLDELLLCWPPNYFPGNVDSACSLTLPLC